MEEARFQEWVKGIINEIEGQIKDGRDRTEVHKIASNKTVVNLELNSQLLFMLVDKAEEESKTIDKWVTEAICEKLF